MINSKNYLQKLQTKSEIVEKSVNEKTLDEKTFYTENNVNGIMNMPKFTTYFGASSVVERSNLHDALDAISNGAKINDVLKKSFDKIHGHEIIWIRPKFPNADLAPLRILFDEQILKLFKSYQRGEFVFKLSLEKLLIEAGVINEEEENS